MTIYRKSPVWCLLACALGVLAGASPAAADDVGAVEVVKRNVYGTPPEGSEMPKHAGNPVAYKETIKTLIDSAALIRFTDGSKLTVGAKSVVQLDEFVYDPGNSAGKALLTVTGGAIRFVTGSMPKGNTTIVTPTATMVLRGTEVTVQVAPDGTTTLNVISGSVDTTATGNKQNTTVNPGRSLKIGHTGFSRSTDNQQGGSPDDLGGNTETGDGVVDNGLGGGPTGGSGRDLTTESTPVEPSSPNAPSTGATTNRNAGSGHGNNGGL
jgi:hypothetical protein